MTSYILFDHTGHLSLLWRSKKMSTLLYLLDDEDRLSLFDLDFSRMDADRFSKPIRRNPFLFRSVIDKADYTREME